MKKIIAAAVFTLMAIISFAENVENMAIKNIVFKNLKEIPEEILKEKMSLKVGDKFSANNMKSDFSFLKTMKYIEDVTVTPEVKDGELVVSVEIKEKENTKELLKSDNIVPVSERNTDDSASIIKRIEIYGCKNVSEEDVKKRLKINIGGVFSKEKVLEGREEILKMGYFRDVSPDAFQYENGIYVKYSVLENPVITGIDITGNKIISTDKLLEGIKTKVGEIYNTDTLREDAEKIIKKYQEKGYVIATIADMRFNEKNILKIVISEGVVSKIEFKGVEQKEEKAGVKNITESEELKEIKIKTKDYIIERELELKTGEVLNLISFKKV